MGGDDITFGLIKQIDLQDTSDSIKLFNKVTREKIQQIEDKYVQKDDIQHFVNEIIETSSNQTERLVRNFSNLLQDWQKSLIELSEFQSKKLEDIEKCLQNLTEQKSQDL